MQFQGSSQVISFDVPWQSITAQDQRLNPGTVEQEIPCPPVTMIGSVEEEKDIHSQSPLLLAVAKTLFKSQMRSNKTRGHFTEAGVSRLLSNLTASAAKGRTAHQELEKAGGKAASLLAQLSHVRNPVPVPERLMSVLHRDASVVFLL